MSGRFEIAYLSSCCWQCTSGDCDGQKTIAVEFLCRIRGMFRGNTTRIVTSEEVACTALGISALEEAAPGLWVSVRCMRATANLFESVSEVEMKGRGADLLFNLKLGSNRRYKKRCAHSTYRILAARPRLVWCTACTRHDL